MVDAQLFPFDGFFFLLVNFESVFYMLKYSNGFCASRAFFSYAASSCSASGLIMASHLKEFWESPADK